MILRDRAAICAVFLLGLSTPAHADVEIKFGGRIQTDLRFQAEEKTTGKYYNKLTIPTGVARNENILKAKLNATYGRFGGVAEVDFVWRGYTNELNELGDLFLREELEPYRLEAHALYVEAADLFTEGLDLRVGQQLIMWGKGDQFNPTNTLNANDLEDKLLFGEQRANLMVRLDYTFIPGGLGEDTEDEPLWDSFTLTAVLIPIFKPALLPTSGLLGVAASDRLPFTDPGLRHRVHTEKWLSQTLYKWPTVVTSADPDEPEMSLDNMQYAFRFSGTAGDVDIALSYYYGRTDFPQPYRNVTTLDQTVPSGCDLKNPSDCARGLIKTDVSLTYPRIHVLGFNIAGQVDALGWISKKVKPIGFWLELGVYFPQEVNITLQQTNQIASQFPGEYPYGPYLAPDGRRPLVVESTPFAKWTLGMDYTFNKHIYMNLQWVHGMVDEFGAGDWINEGWAVRNGGVTQTLGDVLSKCVNMGDVTKNDGSQCAEETLLPRQQDYLVLGVDFKMLSDKLLLRLFTIWAMSGIFKERWDETSQQRVREHHSMFTAEGFSAIIYPELNYNFGRGFELGAGALIQLGNDDTKFGDPAAGGSQVWTRARFSF